MKKLKPLLGGALLMFVCASCSITYHSVTKNPIGDKVGKAKGNDFSFRTAAKKGDIEKIATYKIRYNLFGVPTTTVTGTSD